MLAEALTRDFCTRVLIVGASVPNMFARRVTRHTLHVRLSVMCACFCIAGVGSWGKVVVVVMVVSMVLRTVPNPSLTATGCSDNRSVF